MKKSISLILILITLTITYIGGVVAYSSMSEIRPIEGVVFIVFGFAAIVGITKAILYLKKENNGMTVEDELSTQIKLNAAAKSFSASFLWWTFVLIFTIDSNLNSEIIIGIGLAGMVLIFLGYNYYYNRTGFNENSN